MTGRKNPTAKSCGATARWQRIFRIAVSHYCPRAVHKAKNAKKKKIELHYVFCLVNLTGGEINYSKWFSKRASACRRDFRLTMMWCVCVVVAWSFKFFFYFRTTHGRHIIPRKFRQKVETTCPCIQSIILCAREKLKN